MFAEEEAGLLLAAAETTEDLDEAVRQRVGGIPLEHVLGWAEFCGLRILLDTGVFVPRKRTEFLATQAAALTSSGALVIDLCCGSGAIGAAIAAAVPDITLLATELDAAAVSCAKRNLAGVGQVLRGDLYEPVPDALRGRVDVIVANAPYVPTDELGTLPAEARDHEPALALDGGRDGTHVQKRIFEGAAQWLAPEGHVLVETSQAQAPHITKACALVGLIARTEYSADHESTVVIAQRAPNERRNARLPIQDLAMWATRGPIASANAITPDSGRTITTSSLTSPSSSKRR